MRPTASHFQCRSEVYVFVCMRRMKHMLRPYTVVTTSERAVCVCVRMRCLISAAWAKECVRVLFPVACAVKVCMYCCCVRCI